MAPWILVFHVTAFVLWIGGLMVATRLLGLSAVESDPAGREAAGRAAMSMLRSMADPGAGLGIVTGILMITTNPTYYLHATWLHAKLTLVLLLIVLHVMVRIRAKRFLAGELRMGRQDWVLFNVLVTALFAGILVCVLPLAAFWH